MGTHHTLINGTAYAIKGGTDLIAGTSYQIGGGRTLIDGTEYEIGFNVSLEWKINEEPVIELGTKMYLNVSYTLPDYYGTAGTRLNIYNLGNGSIIGGMTQYGGATFYKDGWKDTTYRRILFDEPPAGELLNWLKDNAIQL